MIRYLINRIINFFTKDEKLLNIANSLISSIICASPDGKNIQSLIIDGVVEVKYIGGKRFVCFTGANVSGTRFSIVLCDIGVIHMRRMNNIFKNIDHRYSLYIKEIWREIRH